MSLGVLNNLSAMYAESSLNNTNNSLTKTLQQLSSGSKINSGADDAAGLSLINGLQANATALAQSQTNATEGVNLLTVADGALSQVTNLLNRAVTLATEVSNGTLDASQNAAANQEYQSILSEINNIGATTTYNQKQVFGSNTSIYVGDSSNQGASINQLNIRSLSSANVGDTNGQMSYSNGTNNVFIDLSSSGKNAAVTDSLGTASATTTIAVSYLTKGASGAAVQASANISVGAGTSYANTAQGLINAINNSGLGITATFGSASQAGGAAQATAVAANDTNSALLTGGGDTGIIISGAGLAVSNSSSGTGFSNGAGEVGTLTVSAANDTLGGTLNIVGADGASHAITLGTANSTDTLANLAATINAAGYGVTATVNTTQTTTAAGAFATGTLMTLTSASSQVRVSGSNITDGQATTAATTSGWATGVNQGDTIGVITVNSSADTLSGVLALTQDKASAATTNLLLGQSGTTDTLTNLASTINAGNATGGTYANILATVTNNANGTQTLTLTQKGAIISGGPSAAVATGSQVQDHAATTGTNPQIVAQTLAVTASTAQYTAFATISVTNASDTLTSGTLNINDIAGQANAVSLGTAGSTDTLANLAYYINHTMDSGSGTNGIKAVLNSAGTQLTLQTNAAASTTNAKLMVYGTNVNSSLSLSGVPTAAGTASATTIGQIALAPGDTAGTALNGTLTLGTETITLGTSASSTAPGTATLGALAQTINSGNYGYSASMDSTGTIMTLTSPNSANISITPTLNTAAQVMLTTNTENKGVISSSYYSLGISGSVQDTSTGANTTGPLTKGLSTDNNGTNGVATISYSDAAGQSLAATDLSNSADAQAALTALNSAIADVAAQDGYIGAQINTLNAVSTVMSTQQQNVVAAQNAVQATDYATAASNMSKYQILSQTGISALAQANSMQQEVLKLLQ